jgi:hypothetical protein
VNKSFIDSFGVTRNNLVVDPKESSSVASGFVYPFVTPEISQKFVNPYWVVCDAVICVSEGGNGFFVRGKRAANGSKLVKSDFGGGVVSVGRKLCVDVLKKISVVTVSRNERVKLVVKRVICNNRGTIQLTLRISAVQNVDSIPKAIIRSRLVGRRRAKECVGL